MNTLENNQTPIHALESFLSKQDAWDTSINLTTRMKDDTVTIDLFIDNAPLSLVFDNTNDHQSVTFLVTNKSKTDPFKISTDMLNTLNLMALFKEDNICVKVEEIRHTRNISFLALITQLEFDNELLRLTDLDINQCYIKAFVAVGSSEQPFVMQCNLDPATMTTITIKPQYDDMTAEKDNLTEISKIASHHNFDVFR